LSYLKNLNSAMKKTKLIDTQIVCALHQAHTDATVAKACHKMDSSEATYYNWKKKYGSWGVPELCQLKQLED
jgi:putative transposase